MRQPVVRLTPDPPVFTVGMKLYRVDDDPYYDARFPSPRLETSTVVGGTSRALRLEVPIPPNHPEYSKKKTTTWRVEISLDQVISADHSLGCCEDCPPYYLSARAAWTAYANEVRWKIEALQADLAVAVSQITPCTDTGPNPTLIEA